MQKGKEMKEIKKNTNIFNWVLKADRDREKQKTKKHKGKIKHKKGKVMTMMPNTEIKIQKGATKKHYKSPIPADKQQIPADKSTKP